MHDHTTIHGPLKQARHLQRHIRLIQLIGIAICLPPLIFPNVMPTWTPPIAIIGLALLWWVGRQIAGQAFVPTPVDLPVMLLMVLLPLNLLISSDHTLTLPHIYKVIGGTALFYGVVGLLQEKPWFRVAALAVHVLGVAIGVLVLFGTQWHGTNPLRILSSVGLEVAPQSKPFWEPVGFSRFNVNLAGGSIALLLPIPISYALFERRLWARSCALMETVALILLLILTSSRGAVLGLTVAVWIMLLAYDRRLGLLAGTLLLSLIIYTLLRGGPIQDWISENQAAASVSGLEQRQELWARGIYMIQDFPFTGVGMGMVEKVMPALYPTFLVSPDAGIQHVHNFYLEMGAELGVPGLIATVALVLALFHLSWQSTQQARGTSWAPLATGLLGTVTVLTIHGLVETIPFSPKAYQLIWMLLGLAVALALHVQPDPDRAPTQNPSGI